jgi:hypothetical protein
MQTVFVLLGKFDYEGSIILGVYTTHDEAKEAYEQYCVENDAFDEFEIEPVEVGAAAEWRW